MPRNAGLAHILPPLLCLVLVMSTSIAQGADVDPHKVTKVKAAYLLNFLKFTDWPDRAFDNRDSPIVVTVLGDDPLGPVLDQTMHNERVNGRPITVQRIPVAADDRRPNGRYTSSARGRLRAELQGSHMVYVSASERDQARQIADDLIQGAALTVGDDPAFARAGMMLALGVEDDRVVFYANRQAIQESALQVSSKVLQLANVLD